MPRKYVKMEQLAEEVFRGKAAGETGKVGQIRISG